MKCCWLKSSDPRYPSIELKDKEGTFLGRSRLTKITDTRVSRKQVQITPNFGRRTVEIKQIGPNDSGINGKPICMGLTLTAKEGDRLDVIFAAESTRNPLHSYKVEFDNDGQAQVSAPSKSTIHATVVENKRTILEAIPSDTPKAAKIPKMFLPKGSTPTDEFRKDSLLKKGKWTSVKEDDFFVYSTDDSLSESKTCVGAFDMDGTLIKTKSGRVFPKDEHDWTFLSSAVVPKLQNFFTQNVDFKFAIFTNQAGLKKASDVPPFKRKIETIVRQIGIPVLVFVGTKKDKYRKPVTGGWEVFVEQFNQGIEPNLQKSFYCGDACGRPKDHSRSDRLFALNIGLSFKTPEEFLEGAKIPQYSPPLFCPKNFLNGIGVNAVGSNDQITYPTRQEMIIMVGYPGSGKSSFVKFALTPKSYVHVNRDTMKSMTKCLQATEAALKEGEKVVIDNTNPTINDRDQFLRIARQHGVTVRCFRFMVDHPHALHNNKFRYLIGDLVSPVPDVAFNSFKASFQEPTESEGYEEIVPVYFVPEFESDARLNLYSKYLLDK